VVSIDLRHLRCFLAVAEHGQVSRAAEEMHLAQPALSQSIRQLERELGIALFERHPRGMRLTPAGTELFVHAESAVRSAAEAISVGHAHRRERQRELRVGFLPPLTHVATEMLGAYERDQPLIHVVIAPITLADYGQAVSRREVDVALLWAGVAEPGVVLEPVLEEPRAVCVGPSHPLAARSELRFAEIEDEPLPRTPDGFPAAVSHALHLGEYRRRPARVTGEVPRSPDEVIWLIASGRAICVGPLSLARAIAQEGMHVIPLIDVAPATISIARRVDDNRATVRALCDIAAERLCAGPTSAHARAG